MNAGTTTMVLAAGTVSTAAQWGRGKGISAKYITSAAFLALTLSFMDEVNDELASRFALLILLGALFYTPKGKNQRSNAEVVLSKVGLTK